MKERIETTTYIGKNKIPLKLKRISKPMRAGTQAIYQDQDGKKWYIKTLEKDFAIKETIASNYFRFLTGQEFSPEVRYMNDGKNHYVMSALTEINEIDHINPPKNLEKCLIGSFLIGEGDCKLENIKENGGNAFRIDFGCTLNIQKKDNAQMALITSADDLRTAFPVLPKFGHKLNPKLLQLESRDLSSKNPNSFDWGSWENLCKEENVDINLKEQKQLVIERSKILKKLTSPNFQNEYNKDGVDENLIKFYQLLEEEKRNTGDSVFIKQTPEILACKHMRYEEQYGEYPAVYDQVLKSAEFKEQINKIGSFGLNIRKDFTPSESVALRIKSSAKEKEVIKEFFNKYDSKLSESNLKFARQSHWRSKTNQKISDEKSIVDNSVSLQTIVTHARKGFGFSENRSARTLVDLGWIRKKRASLGFFSKIYTSSKDYEVNPEGNAPESFKKAWEMSS